MPFTLTTIDPGNAHLQACIGYDTCRKTLIIRDPTLRHWTEFLADTMLDHYRSVGRAAWRWCPKSRPLCCKTSICPSGAVRPGLSASTRLAGPRPRSRRRPLSEFAQTAPDQRLTLQARRILAIYDADSAELFAGIEELLKRFPDDPLMTLSKISALRELARRNERLALLQKMVGLKGSDPLFWRRYPQEMSANAREHPTAMRLLKRVFRFRPYDEGALAILANILWDQRRFEEAMELYGFAACLGDKDEGLRAAGSRPLAI